jgi:hypothetical protein
MKSGFHKFLIGFTLFTLAVAIISSVIYIWLPDIPVSPVYPYIILFIYLLTLLIVRQLIKSLKDKPNRFVNTFMLMNFGKLALFTVIMFIYAWFNRPDAVGFIVTFFTYYLLFTTYEITILLRLSRNTSK